MRNTFKVMFYINAGKAKGGAAPIMGRVTVNGQVAQFSCKQTVPVALWDANGNRAKGNNDLRYRYIEMRNGIGPEEVMQPRDVFESNRATETIKKLRKTVGDYERHVRQQTENTARARFNASEAERLKKEA